MYHKKFYKRKSEEKISDLIKEEGFIPVIITNGPNYQYNPHTHPETKLLAILDGNMEVNVNDEVYNLSRWDKLIIPGDTPHSAKVGTKGCRFYWSEKIL